MNTREGHRIIADEEEKTGVYIESGGPKSPTSAAAAPLGERQQQPGSDGNRVYCILLGLGTTSGMFQKAPKLSLISGSVVIV